MPRLPGGMQGFRGMNDFGARSRGIFDSPPKDGGSTRGQGQSNQLEGQGIGNSPQCRDHRRADDRPEENPTATHHMPQEHWNEHFFGSARWFRLLSHRNSFPHRPETPASFSSSDFPTLKARGFAGLLRTAPDCGVSPVRRHPRWKSGECPDVSRSSASQFPWRGRNARSGRTCRPHLP